MTSPAAMSISLSRLWSEFSGKWPIFRYAKRKGQDGSIPSYCAPKLRKLLKTKSKIVQSQWIETHQQGYYSMVKWD